MRITIEIDSKSEMEKLFVLLQTFKINTVNVLSADDTAIPIVKGDKSIDPKALFGIWASQPRTIESIRDTGWKRK